VNIWRGLPTLAKTVRDILARAYTFKTNVGGYSPLSAATLSLNRGAAMENMERLLPTAPVLQRKAKSLLEDFQFQEGDGGEHDELNAS
jgi:hypothetical protein